MEDVNETKNEDTLFIKIIKKMSLMKINLNSVILI